MEIHIPVKQNHLTDVQHLDNGTHLKGNQRVAEIAVGVKLTHPTKRSSKTKTGRLALSTQKIRRNTPA